MGPLTRNIWGTWGLLLLCAGCATGIDRNYSNQLDHLLAARRPKDAAAEVVAAGEAVYGERNRLLYHMDLGLALQLAGDYRRSAGQLEKADALAHDLYTRSLTSEAGSLFTSDLVVPYAGEAFERVLINVFNALNYAFMGNVEEALVEARRIDVKFKEMQGHRAGRYQVEPFAHYLSALLFEAWQDVDAAVVSLRRAREGYEALAGLTGVGVPPGLTADLARLEALQEAGGERAAGGELVVLHYFGPGPRKVERFFELSLGRGMAHAYAMEVRSEEQKRLRQTLSVAKGMASDTQISLAYPVFEQPPLAAHYGTVDASGCGVAHSVLVANVSRVAEVDLEDRIKAAWGRMVARAVVKFVSARAAGAVGEEISNNKAVGLLVRILTQGVMSATEEADIRGWRTLPAEIHLTRLRCPAGTYTVEVRHGGGVRGDFINYPEVRIADGTKTFVLADSY